MFTYKELIDVAIGSPESGHVNFYALQVLLTCFAQRLEVLDKVVEQDDCLVANIHKQESFLTLGRDFRLFGGEDVKEAVPEESAGGAPVEQVEPPPTEVEAKADEIKSTAPEPKSEEIESTAPETVEKVKSEEIDSRTQETVEKVKSEEIDSTGPEPVEKAKSEDIDSTGPEPVEKVKSEEIDSTTAQSEPVEKTRVDGSIPDESAGDLAAQQPPAPTHAKEDNVSFSSRASSRRSTMQKQRSESAIINNIMRLERRVLLVEQMREKEVMDMQQFSHNLMARMNLTMEQVNNVAHMLIDRRPDPLRLKVIRVFAKQLRSLMETTDREVSISWSASDEIEVGVGEEGLIEEEFHEESLEATAEWTPEPDDSDSDLPLTFDRVNSGIQDLKSQICVLTNKVNDLAAALVNQDCQRLLSTIMELQGSIHELQGYRRSSWETISNTMERLNEAVKQIDTIKRSAALLEVMKSDRDEVELWLAEKVNFQQLGSKVSLEQLEAHRTGLEKRFCEIRQLSNASEKNILQIIDRLRMTLGIDAMEVSLKDFRKVIEGRVRVIADALQSYMDMTNDECSASGGRVKILQDLACLSCDSTCSMRTVERKLPALPKAKGSIGLGPIVAYDVGQIRNPGVMGYSCRDNLPHMPSGWTKRPPTMAKCAPRHAGGVHTVHTAADHVQKVVLSKKNTGWI